MMRIVLTGGGTGGHIYPALSLWHFLHERHPDAEVLYVGTEQGLERGIVEHAGLPFTSIRAAGLKRQISLSALRTAALTYRGYIQAKKLLRKFQPDVVLGTGGYVTLPVVMAAASRGIPSVVWEANARPGLTNQLCAKRAAAVAISFPGSERWFSGARRIVCTGNPRASEVRDVIQQAKDAARERYDVRVHRKLILFYAGSRGAEIVNDVMMKLLPKFRDRPDWQLIYVTGEAHYEHCKRVLPHLPENVQVYPFVHDMPSLLPLAEVAITRAGGATLAEIASLGLASILIPSPHVTANHQEENARPLAEAGAAMMLREADLTPDVLWDAIGTVLDTGKGAIMRDCVRQFATPEAVSNLYQLVMEAVESR